MIRISRIVSKCKVVDLLCLHFISKVEVKQGEQGFNNPDICRVNIYLNPGPKRYFSDEMNKIIKWGEDNKCKIAETTAITALNFGFIKESAFDDFNYPMPHNYKKMCEFYSDEFFEHFNKKEI